MTEKNQRTFSSLSLWIPFLLTFLLLFFAFYSFILHLVIVSIIRILIVKPRYRVYGLMQLSAGYPANFIIRFITNQSPPTFLRLWLRLSLVGMSSSDSLDELYTTRYLDLPIIRTHPVTNFNQSNIYISTNYSKLDRTSWTPSIHF